jgi:hypothetical protein
MKGMRVEMRAVAKRVAKVAGMMTALIRTKMMMKIQPVHIHRYAPADAV